MDTGQFRNGIYAETGLPNCEELYTGNQTVLTFTVDPTDTLDPGCGTLIVSTCDVEKTDLEHPADILYLLIQYYFVFLSTTRRPLTLLTVRLYR